MFRLYKAMHSKTPVLLLGNRYPMRYISFKVDPEDQDRWKVYRAQMSELRWQCKMEIDALLEAEKKKKEEYDKKFSWEFRFADAYKYAAEINEKQNAKLLAMQQERKVEYEVRKAEEEKVEKIERAEKEIIEKAEMKREYEIAESYITPKNIEQLLDDALDNPITHNFSFPKVRVSGDGKGVKNFDEEGELILHEGIPNI